VRIATTLFFYILQTTALKRFNFFLEYLLSCIILEPYIKNGISEQSMFEYRASAMLLLLVWESKGLFTRCQLLASQFDSSWIPNWPAATG
jgi:hypothetical protein